MSAAIFKTGDLVRLRETDSTGNKLFVNESDLAMCVGWVFIVADVSIRQLEYPIHCKVLPLYVGSAPSSLRNGISLKHEEVELLQ